MPACRRLLAGCAFGAALTAVVIGPAWTQSLPELRSSLDQFGEPFGEQPPMEGAAPQPVPQPAPVRPAVSPVQANPSAPTLSLGDQTHPQNGSQTRNAGNSALPLPGDDVSVAALPPVDAPQQRRAARDETDPYAPLGLRAGAFNLFPTLGLSAVYTDNVAQTAQGEMDDVGLRLTPGLRLESNWVRHSFTLNASGTALFYADNSAFDQTTANAAAALRLDVRRTTTANFTADYQLTETSAADREVPDAATGRRRDMQFGGTAGLSHRFNRLTVTGTAGLRYAMFDDVELAGGGVEDNSDRDYLEPSVSLRLGYETSPAVQPFVEVGYRPRIHSRRRDRDGLRRSSHGGFVRAGADLNLSPIWSGNVGVRYDVRAFEEPGLETIHAFGGDANLTWRPTRLTDVVFTAGSTIDESTGAGVSGSRTLTGGIAISHAFRQNLRGGASAGVEFRNFIVAADEELTLTGGLSLSYLISREIEVLANYDVTGFESTVPGADYIENQISAGFNFRL